MWRCALLASLAAGCGAQLSDGAADSSHPIVDAPPGTQPDSSTPPIVDAPSAPPACANGRVVYLAFEGETITYAATTDATANQASWIGVNTANVPPYHQSNTNRNTQITNITNGVTAVLSSYPITVVTQRPTSGSYVMVVFGGSNQTVGSNYTYATANHDCGDVVKSDVGWVSDQVPNSIVVPTTIGTIGWALGLQGTNDPGDCMCGWATNCSPSSTCTLGTNETTGNSLSPATTCPGLNPQNEQAAFQAAFCN
jgi:hypothetical protein